MQLHLGWHFCALRDGVPVLRDGSPLRVRHLYEHPRRLVMCRAGYHDSARVIDAVRYAPGDALCRVLVSADLNDADKRCSRYRMTLAWIDAERILFEFAAKIAYCTLLDRDEMRRFCPDARATETGSISGWRVTFAAHGLGGSGGGCHLVAEPGHAVHGLLYEMDDATLAQLDQISGVAQGMYRQIDVRV